MKITGRVAQFGSGVIKQASEKLLGLIVVAVISYLLVR
jgi:carbon monoxide dehydrogenase subunit G